MCRRYLSMPGDDLPVHRGGAKSSSLRCGSGSRNRVLLLSSNQCRNRCLNQYRKLVQIRLRSRVPAASRCRCRLLSKRTQAEYRRNRKSGRPSVLSCRLCRQLSRSRRWKCPLPHRRLYRHLDCVRLEFHEVFSDVSDCGDRSQSELNCSRGSVAVRLISPAVSFPSAGGNIVWIRSRQFCGW
jgi:hypothetical protein